MCFIIRLKAIKNHDFAISLESKVFEKSQGLSLGLNKSKELHEESNRIKKLLHFKQKQLLRFID